MDMVDEVLEDMGKPYTEVLLFLWALHHIEGDIKPPTIATLQDNATIAWDEATKKDLFPTTKETATLDLTEMTTPPILSHEGEISAMTKLLACMIKHQEAEL